MSGSLDTCWPFEVKHVAKKEIEQYCPDPDWQKVRLSMKGTSTQEKMQILNRWRNRHLINQEFLPRKIEVQIDNYVNALKRGGQLDVEGNIQR